MQRCVTVWGQGSCKSALQYVCFIKEWNLVLSFFVVDIFLYTHWEIWLRICKIDVICKLMEILWRKAHHNARNHPCSFWIFSYHYISHYGHSVTTWVWLNCNCNYIIKFHIQSTCLVWYGMGYTLLKLNVQYVVIKTGKNI